MRFLYLPLLFCLTTVTVTAQHFPYVAQRFAGDSNPGEGGPATSALLNGPRDIEFDRDGNAYVLESVNKRITKITPAGVISTLFPLSFEGRDMARAARMPVSS